MVVYIENPVLAITVRTDRKLRFVNNGYVLRLMHVGNNG